MYLARCRREVDQGVQLCDKRCLVAGHCDVGIIMVNVVRVGMLRIIVHPDLSDPFRNIRTPLQNIIHPLIVHKGTILHP